ncbi:hypothetical protein [Pelotomaculum propionicicum]|uniref:Uncharacterized protein n=1 Tax=Pelotomaculum propionicicum TaxID=258475 RepID=A0A4Y7RWJ7_9FIRM|nr:hypothetical protein [Pelotomaculum propionicicum]TEB13365.1 hypothetical protein Pmgp_00259 [Pelotomaculum propionicicum]
MSSKKSIVDAAIEASETPAPEVQQAPATKPAPFIYCGPTLPKGLLLQYTTYRGGLPNHLEPHIEKCPAIGRLFVAPTQLDSTIQAIKKAGTPESVWYKQILDYIKGGVK